MFPAKALSSEAAKIKDGRYVFFYLCCFAALLLSAFA